MEKQKRVARVKSRFSHLDGEEVLAFPGLKVGDVAKAGHVSEGDGEVEAAPVVARPFVRGCVHCSALRHIFPPITLAVDF